MPDTSRAHPDGGALWRERCRPLDERARVFTGKRHSALEQRLRELIVAVGGDSSSSGQQDDEQIYGQTR
ncbi:MAG: hypothetical protein EB084_19780 [Proteobacteria bacterium]|nr:hypothetical protein [Pseudomonadota bacterium]